MKILALYAMSILSLIVGILGIADVNFFNSSLSLAFFQVWFGAIGLIASAW